MTYIVRYLPLGVILFLVGSHASRAQEFYTVQQIDQAKAKARDKHLPIAWLSSPMGYLNANYANETQGIPAELTQLGP